MAGHLLHIETIQCLKKVNACAKVWHEELKVFIQDQIEDKALTSYVDVSDFLTSLQKPMLTLVDAIDRILGAEAITSTDKTHTHQNESLCLWNCVYAVYVFKCLHVMPTKEMYHNEEHGFANMFCTLSNIFKEVFNKYCRDINVNSGAKVTVCNLKYSKNLYVLFRELHNLVENLTHQCSWWSCLHHRQHALDGIYLTSCSSANCIVCKSTQDSKGRKILAFSQYTQKKIRGNNIKKNFALIQQHLFNKLSFCLQCLQENTEFYFHICKLLLKNETYRTPENLLQIQKALAISKIKNYGRVPTQKFLFSDLCEDRYDDVKNTIAVVEQAEEEYGQLSNECRRLLTDKRFIEHLEKKFGFEKHDDIEETQMYLPIQTKYEEAVKVLDTQQEFPWLYDAKKIHPASLDDTEENTAFDIVDIAVPLDEHEVKTEFALPVVEATPLRNKKSSSVYKQVEGFLPSKEFSEEDTKTEDLRNYVMTPIASIEEEEKAPHIKNRKFTLREN